MRKIGVLLVVSLFVGGCSSVEILTDYDKNIDFSRYETYTFLPWNKDNSKMVNQFGQRRFYNALREELNARGYREVEEGADLAVNVIVLIDKKTATQAYSNYYGPGGYGYGYYYGGFGFGYSSTRYYEYEYLKGTLIVDIFNASNKNLIWQSGAIGEVDPNLSETEKERRIRIIMKRMFSKYPVPKQK